MVLSKMASSSWLLKMLIGVAVVVAFLFLGSSLISYGKEFLGGIVGGTIDACPSDLLEPRKCYCGTELLNPDIGKSGFNPDNNKAFCYDGTPTDRPYACRDINTCADYDTNRKFVESIDTRQRFCNENVCSKYFDNAMTKCEIQTIDAKEQCVEVKQ